MLQVKNVDEIKTLGSILFIGAHPDDETFVAAGIIAAACQNRQRVACITATRGEKGVQNELKWPAAKLAGIRTRELEAALEILGPVEHHWLDYEDGYCKHVAEGEATARLRKIIGQYKPDTILTFGIDGLTGHPDHKAVSKWTVAAAGQTPVYFVVTEESVYRQYMRTADQQLNIFFNIDKPALKKLSDCKIALNLSPELLSLKERALKAMPSQYAGMFEKMPQNFMREALGLECFV